MGEGWPRPQHLFPAPPSPSPQSPRGGRGPVVERFSWDGTGREVVEEEGEEAAGEKMPAKMPVTCPKRENAHHCQNGGESREESLRPPCPPASQPGSVPANVKCHKCVCCNGASERENFPA